MPLSSVVLAQAMRLVGAVALAVAVMAPAQSAVTDADLVEASRGRTVRLGATIDGDVATVPLEVYVARVLAGEGEPAAASAAQEALAVAARSFALANLGRHETEGFDVCDATHCQVPRPATPQSRGAALATAGLVLLYEGRPAELFYSASCGGYSERADQVWPGADLPYLQVVADDVHAEDEPWTRELRLDEVQAALRLAGFGGGPLTDVVIAERSVAGRAVRLRLSGLLPETISGAQFRAAVGANVVRSTAFAIERVGSRLVLTGRGYGHGVGMCVIGAGRRALRGDSVDAILGHYYPGLELTDLDALPAVAPAVAEAGSLVGGAGQILVRVPRVSPVSVDELERATLDAYEDLSSRLGIAVAPITVELHDSIPSFRQATGRPWWVSAVVTGTLIDLAPAAVLAQQASLDEVVRVAIAELLMSESLMGRPRWIKVGAARYFARGASPSERSGAGTCPSEAELLLALSAAAQREAEARADACFVSALARAGDWRAVR